MDLSRVARAAILGGGAISLGLLLFYLLATVFIPIFEASWIEHIPFRGQLNTEITNISKNQPGKLGDESYMNKRGKWIYTDNHVQKGDAGVNRIFGNRLKSKEQTSIYDNSRSTEPISQEVASNDTSFTGMTGHDIYVWSKRKFRGIWNENYMESCVNHCSPNKYILFNLTKDIKCSENFVCSYERIPSHKETLAKNHITLNPKCRSNREALCPRTLVSGCDSFTWVIRRVTLEAYGKIQKRLVLDLTMREGHPFKIHSVIPSGDPRYLLVISFYLPNVLFRGKCNRLYCIFFDVGRNIFEYASAIAGDASFTYCHYPSFPISNQTRLQLAYRPEIMSSTYPVVIEPPVTNIPYVSMTICTMVRKEAKNLVEWIEFHRMMGYDRFIIYDNNPFEEPDGFMEKLLAIYPPDVVVRRHWKQLHSQTEAYTDCINRYRKVTYWMTLIDVDEFIVPYPSYPSVRYVLENILSEHPNIHVTWLTFGPCGDAKRMEGELMMDLCNRTTRSSSDYPKAIFKAKMAAGMQNYGPHYIRMKKDLGRRIMSESVGADGYLRNYHYRYRTYGEFIERRQGPRAGRALTWTTEDLDREWEEGIKHSEELKAEENWISRFREELSERTKGIFEELHRNGGTES